MGRPTPGRPLLRPPLWIYHLRSGKVILDIIIISCCVSHIWVLLLKSYRTSVTIAAILNKALPVRFDSVGSSSRSSNSLN